MKTLMGAFRVNGPPRPKGRPRFSRRTGRTFTPPATEMAERTLAGELAFLVREDNQRNRHNPKMAQWPVDGALEVEIEFILPIPGSWSQKERKRAEEGKRAHTSRPDIDNLGKLVMDACNGVLWLDDAQLVCVTLRKEYGETPATSVCVYRPEER